MYIHKVVDNVHKSVDKYGFLLKMRFYRRLIKLDELLGVLLNCG
ncbi:hypothetical protein [Paenibacillus sp. ACRSA]|nr:hypothetical protein [Paenibacillus sp. ACRSA]